MRSIFIWAALSPLAAAWLQPSRALVPRRRCSPALLALGGSGATSEAHLVRGAPTAAVLSWLANDWARGVNRRDAAMPLVPSAEPWGMCLRFQACPDDTIEVLVNPVNPASGVGCVVAVKRGEGGSAASMGRQVASLVAAAERDVASRLSHDLRAKFPSTVACEVALDPATGQVLGVRVPGDELCDAGGSNGGSSSGSSSSSSSSSTMVDAEIVPPARDFAPPDSEPQLPPELANLDPSRLSDESVEELGRAALRAAAIEAGATVAVLDVAGAAKDELSLAELGLLGADPDLPPDFVAGIAEVAKAANLTAAELAKIFARGSELAAAFSSEAGGGLARRGVGALAQSAEDFEVVDDELVRLSVALAGSGLDGGLDLFSGPNQGGTGPAGALAGSAAGLARKAAAVAAAAAAQQQQQQQQQQPGGPSGGSGAGSARGANGALGGGVESARLSFFRGPVDDPSLLPPHEAQALAQVSGSLAVLVRELRRPGASDLAPQILSSYRDVVLSEWYPAAARRFLATLPPEDAAGGGSESGQGALLAKGASSSARAALAQVNSYALVCAEALGDALAAAEHAQLEKVRRICEVAMDDMAKLPAAVAAMKPLLDDDLVAFLGYAIDRERDLCRSRGLNPDLAPTTWLQVLGLVRQGVYAELGKALREDIKALLLCLRMPDPETQRGLFELTVSKLPAWDARQFHKVTTNVVANFALRGEGAASPSTGTRGSGVDSVLAAKVAQLGVDLAHFLPLAKLNELAKPADEARGLLNQGEGGLADGPAYGGVLGSGAGFGLTNGLDYS